MSDNKMPKTIRFTALVSLALLALVAGCSVESDSSQTPVNQTETATTQEKPERVVKPVKNPNRPLTASPDKPDSTTQQQIQPYLNSLSSKGFAKESQGIWIQTNKTLLANNQGTVPLSAASITKVATSLATLSTLGPDHEFVTIIGATGPIKDGVLQGDLVIQGAEDPFFVWEEAIALGNQLNEIGIKRVTGNLVIAGKFYMNFIADPLKSGELLRQGLNSQLWSTEAQTQHQTLPPGTPQPQVKIDGSLQVSPLAPSNMQLLVRHHSFPVAELLKKMNRYSNNKMAEMLANTVGGAKVVAQKAAEASGVPPEEISLINGSGLGVDNRISPRAAAAMFLGIERYLKPYQMNVGDIFTVVGQDEGILDERELPQFSVIKSGSLDDVSALAGALPTEEKGTVWFVIMNSGKANLTGFRTAQESFLNELVNQWGTAQSLPPELTPNPTRENKTSRNEVVEQSADQVSN
ncbi:D-alanyl-D-alanine carboxypeptidase [Lyngbya aestuarii]|uniref:D-alanyl-D-alanine carboxypeptidase n=1 Tax=Lyngbya aestuarii TaxID=118322 RepID=UPI00403D68A5